MLAASIRKGAPMGKRVVTVNSAATSKINWVNGVAFLAGVAAIFGLDISEDLQGKIAVGITTVLPLVNILLRTFMTAKPT